MNIFESIFFIIPFAFTPGPVNITLAAIGSLNGFKKAFKFILGLSVAFFLQSGLVAIGFNELFKIFPNLEIIIKILGSIYILYLAYLLYKTTPNKKSFDLNFMNGFFMSILNPKVWVTLSIYLAVFNSKLILHEMIYVMVATITFFLGNSLWCYLGSLFSGYISKYYKIFKNIFVLMLLGVVVYILL
jgi:threonine/homoserine/homoserine lactone efflux protein